MRGADEVFKLKKGIVWGRGLLFKDVQGRPGHLARDHGLVEVVLLDDTSPGTVDEKDPVLHLGKLLFVNEAPGLLGKWHVHRYYVRLGEEFIKTHDFDSHFGSLFRVDVRVVGNDAHLEPLGPVRHHGTDAPKPDDA